MGRLIYIHASSSIYSLTSDVCDRDKAGGGIKLAALLHIENVNRPLPMLLFPEAP